MAGRTDTTNLPWRTDMKKRLGERLLEVGLIDDIQLSAALGDQRKWGGKLGNTLVRKGFVRDTDLVPVLGRHLGVRCVRLRGRHIPKAIVNRIPAETARMHRVIPVAMDGRSLVVAMVDPSDLQTIDTLQFTTNLSVRPVLGAEAEIQFAIEEHYGGERPADFAPIPLAAPTNKTWRESPNRPTRQSADQTLCGGSCAEKVDALIRLLAEKGLITQAELKETIRLSRSLSQHGLS